ncbi:MAG: hypothetical protein F4162_08455 [Synechococcus sp. SB0676_bin_10]|uniref:Uncharacterized protein n=1 Tax=Synechococcus sp. SB0676_bin_10 TaxID=2604869 RepID=A0A6B1F6H8_9SYNE|nr:hypothetical protein [Synechococcus sp. SB0676_bin_10]MYG64435.1 hypothetical protein [Synechococcus sp. SB0675_bin_7]MYK84925.1 hypothetical protein [Synechococcus sp. SB0669_bin_7]
MITPAHAAKAQAMEEKAPSPGGTRRHRAREESYPHAGGVPERRRLQVQRTTGMSSGVSPGQGFRIPAAAVDWSFQTMGYLVS